MPVPPETITIPLFVGVEFSPDTVAVPPEYDTSIPSPGETLPAPI